MRASGRTIRIIDQCIQDLFIKGYCLCIDHHETIDACRFLFEGVLRRLNVEHRELLKGLVIDKNNMIIYFKGVVITKEINKMKDYLRSICH